MQVSSGQGKEKHWGKEGGSCNERVMVVYDLSPCQESRSLSSSLEIQLSQCKSSPSGSPTCIEASCLLLNVSCVRLPLLLRDCMPSFSVHVLFINFLHISILIKIFL